jgi:hypothetical protein
MTKDIPDENYNEKDPAIFKQIDFTPKSSKRPRLFLAPMVRISTLPMRLLTLEYGAGWDVVVLHY